MNEAPLGVLFAILVVLIFCSAFFSSSETSMMSLNRYRLKHLIKKKHRAATRAYNLLERPDRLIGIILIGNNLVNILATTIATIIAIRLFGDAGIAIVGVVLTLVILIFAEVTPKTLAALYPEKIAFPASLILSPLLYIFHPFVWLVSNLSNGLLRLFRVNPESSDNHSLTPEELRTVVNESGHMISPRYRSMLLNILDLEQMTVEDIMIPRNEVVGINLDDEISIILKSLGKSAYTRMPVYQGNINNMVGILHMRNVTRFMKNGALPTDSQCILDNMRAPYFIPESTPLNVQLWNFQKEKRRIGIVVDEYGDVQGLITLEDLLEEIVGEFTTNISDISDDIYHQPDGSIIIDCSATIREINKQLKWHLNTDGPKTLNGLITEYLGKIPSNNICFSLENYRFETIEIMDNRIKTVKAQEVILQKNPLKD